MGGEWGGGGFLLVDSFHRFLGEIPGGLHEILVCGGSPHGEIVFCAVSIYSFIICLFIVCLCVCFLIIFKQLFVGSYINLAPLEGEGWEGWGGLFLWSCVAVFVD